MTHEKVMPYTFVPATAYIGLPIQIKVWTDPPFMETGYPNPKLFQNGETLFVSYDRQFPEPGFEVGLSYSPAFAVLRFDGVNEQYIGPPNDEALHQHPLYPMGLSFYDYYKVIGSPKAIAPLQHWILTFHDETVEVVARAATVAYLGVINEDVEEVVERLIKEKR